MVYLEPVYHLRPSTFQNQGHLGYYIMQTYSLSKDVSRKILRLVHQLPLQFPFRVPNFFSRCRLSFSWNHVQPRWFQPRCCPNQDVKRAKCGAWPKTQLSSHENGMAFWGNHLWSISSFRRHWNLGRLCWRRFPLRWMTICGWRDKPDIHQTVPNLHVTACICGNHFSWSCRSCLLLLEAQAGFHHSEECTNVPMLQ